jgi:hypothetical protein
VPDSPSVDPAPYPGGSHASGALAVFRDLAYAVGNDTGGGEERRRAREQWESVLADALAGRRAPTLELALAAAWWLGPAGCAVLRSLWSPG